MTAFDNEKPGDPRFTLRSSPEEKCANWRLPDLPRQSGLVAHGVPEVTESDWNQ